MYLIVHAHGLHVKDQHTCMQVTTLVGFMGIVIDMTNMSHLIMQYKPYIVEQSCTGISVGKCHLCTCGKTTDTHEQYSGNMFISITLAL